MSTATVACRGPANRGTSSWSRSPERWRHSSGPSPVWHSPSSRQHRSVATQQTKRQPGKEEGGEVPVAQRWARRQVRATLDLIRRHQPATLRREKPKTNTGPAVTNPRVEILINRRLAPPRPPLCNLISRTPQNAANLHTKHLENEHENQTCTASGKPPATSPLLGLGIIPTGRTVGLDGKSARRGDV